MEGTGSLAADSRLASQPVHKTDPRTLKRGCQAVAVAAPRGNAFAHMMAKQREHCQSWTFFLGRRTSGELHWHISRDAKRRKLTASAGLLASDPDPLCDEVNIEC
jgi:hypothetical protein